MSSPSSRFANISPNPSNMLPVPFGPIWTCQKQPESFQPIACSLVWSARNSIHWPMERRGRQTSCANGHPGTMNGLSGKCTLKANCPHRGFHHSRSLCCSAGVSSASISGVMCCKIGHPSPYLYPSCLRYSSFTHPGRCWSSCRWNIRYNDSGIRLPLKK